MLTDPIPEGFHSITPYLIVRGAAAALDFYATAFGAQETMRLAAPGGGKVMHAEMKVGNSPIMLADEFPEMHALGPKAHGGSPVGLVLYVENADAVFQQAVEAGAAVKRPMADQFYGDRSGMVEDPFGHQWTIATRKENLSAEEIARRMPGSGA